MEINFNQIETKFYGNKPYLNSIKFNWIETNLKNWNKLKKLNWIKMNSNLN